MRKTKKKPTSFTCKDKEILFKGDLGMPKGAYLIYGRLRGSSERFYPFVNDKTHPFQNVNLLYANVWWERETAERVLAELKQKLPQYEMEIR